MDYSLENLGDERFQELCQALLVKAFPKTQCFPVGQPDGGRDAMSYYLDHESDGFIVFQVKFARNPRAEKDPRGWLKKALMLEAPKLKELIPKGAKQYYVLTNVPGTAHPGSGSIDVVQGLLNKHVDIPAQCWWRDDINRRLDDAWSIKWSYPEILSSLDIIRSIIENGLTEDAQRRTSTIRAFIKDQYDRETEVRFKQVELQNKLLDLFIDVPIELRDTSMQRQVRRQEFAAIHAIEQEFISSNHPHESAIGAATFLLHPILQAFVSRVVVEGAPGQGKSTIVQYLCQIHRQRILNEGTNDSRIPAQHLRNPIRLPFKIDCRDLSLWLNRQNPFSADEIVRSDWQKSLESFLAAHVTNYSGGAAFNVSDLHAVLKLSSALLVFDGLDEVADIARRREVVDCISQGVSRLSEIAASLQTIVTSRPAAFANSPGMPEETFRYFHLASLNRPLIEEYADKWLKARKLAGKEASDVRRILRDKLDQPHLRELARNPMQLAILLSLIQTRGGSLPDKRTALYDSYVELFFNREAEKSSILRDHRDLLIDIHRYLAWILHAEAQTKQSQGSVSTDRLRDLVSTYLADEGRDPSLTKQLFTGMVERVVALVSKVEGTYEFEVQPLREYFAARHLYNTAPYSPTGREQGGTLPDRFDALSRDFFWQNVTRFYAGCYSKGELPSLVDRLEVLAGASGYRNTSHPTSLAATLLGDWVFAQHPRSMKQIVALILNALGLRHAASGTRRNRRDYPLVLPKQNGNDELLDRCFTLLSSALPSDYAEMLIELIGANSTREETTARWLLPCRSMSGSARTRSIDYGLHLGVLSNLAEENLVAVLDDAADVPERLNLYLRGGNTQFIDADESRFSSVVMYMLDKTSDIGPRRGGSVADAFGQIISPVRYACAFQNRHPMALHRLWSRMYGYPDESDSTQFVGVIPKFDIAQKCSRIIEVGRRVSELPGEEWATKLEPWNELVEKGREEFGDHWAFFILANTAAGIRSKGETYDEASELVDRNVPLCRRVRYARLRAGAAAWWESQLADLTDQGDLAFALMVLLTWAGPTVFQKHAGLIDEKLCALDSHSWLKVIDSVQFAAYAFAQDKRDIAIEVTAIPKKLSERTIVAWSTRLNESSSNRLFKEYLTEYDGSDLAVLGFCQRSALRAAQPNPEDWHKWLPIISRSYAKGGEADRYFGYRFTRAVQSQGLPYHIAEEIVEKCGEYPIDLVAWAEEVCRQNVAEKVTPVGVIAEKQNWFRI